MRIGRFSKADLLGAGYGEVPTSAVAQKLGLEASWVSKLALRFGLRGPVRSPGRTPTKWTARNGTPTERSCLGCGKDFTAFGPFNRLCPRCRRQVGDLAGSRFTEGGEYG